MIPLCGIHDTEPYQELSYRKQIAYQLCTQYIEGVYVYSNTVTLKFRLGVTEDHWKWHHSMNHIQLTIS